jgi:hypothetical protein
VAISAAARRLQWVSSAPFGVPGRARVVEDQGGVVIGALGGLGDRLGGVEVLLELARLD